MMLVALYAGGGKSSWLWAARLFCRHHYRRALSLAGRAIADDKVAPARILSMMMGCGWRRVFAGGFLAGFIGSFWSRMRKPEFFLLVAAIATLASAMIFACRWPLKGALRE